MLPWKKQAGHVGWTQSSTIPSVFCRPHKMFYRKIKEKEVACLSRGQGPDNSLTLIWGK